MTKATPFDFPTSYNSPEKIFLGGSSAAWDVYPDRPMSANEFLNMIKHLCYDLVDTETVKYRFLWDGDNDYINIGRYELETDQQFKVRQQRLQTSEALKRQNAELEAEANHVLEQIPAHLRDLIRNKLGDKNG